MAGSPAYFNNGAGSLVVNGAGIVRLHAVDTYTGGTTLGGRATLELGAASAAGSGAIDFASGTACLAIAAGVIPANTIGLLQTGDVIDAAGFQGGGAAFDPGTHTLTFTHGTASLALTLDAAYAPGSFVGTNDARGHRPRGHVHGLLRARHADPDGARRGSDRAAAGRRARGDRRRTVHADPVARQPPHRLP
jgi:hypothetical protein